jgi:HEAT repeat protein
VKQQVRDLLADKRFDDVARLAGKRKRVLGVLVSLTYDTDALIAWRAVEATGLAAARIAETNPEFARSHLRRLHWLLSEESGSICRHAPQAMAEIVVRRPDLFGEYGPIVVSLLTDMAEEDLASGFRPAVLWAIGRIAPVLGDEIEPVVQLIAASLDDPDPQVRGTAVWCLLQAGMRDVLAERPALLADDGEVELYGDGRFERTTVGALMRA